jgi:TolB-like protein
MNRSNELSNYRIFSRLIITGLCILAFIVTGCSNGMKSFVRKNTDFSSIQKIAVMPLENFTPNKYAADKIRSMILIELLSKGMDVIEPGQVVSAMRELKIRSVAGMSVEDMRNIGEMLDVDALVVGSVETYNISRGISVSYPEASIRLTLIGSQDGLALWSIWHTTGGADFWTRHFGAEGRTLDEAARTVVKEALETLF